MIYAFRVLVWAPFAFVSNIPVLILANIAAYHFATYGYPVFLFGSIVLCGLAIPFEASLRPPQRHTSKLPQRDRPILPSLALIAVKARKRAPRVPQIVRRLQPELQLLLASPVNRQPEAITHDRRIAELAK